MKNFGQGERTMWLFGKRISIKKLTREDEPEEDPPDEELPSFAPVVISDEPDASENLNKSDELEPILPSFEDDEDTSLLSFENITAGADGTSNEAADPCSLQNPSQTEDAESTEAEFVPHGEQGAPLPSEDGGEDPQGIYERLSALPLAARTYALYEGRMLLAHSDRNGGLYLFAEYGDYTIASPGDCKAFVRLTGLDGVFRGKAYSISDFEYIIKEHMWPLSVSARNKQEYTDYIDQGFAPYGKTTDGRGMTLRKALSLYRLKDLCLHVDLTLTGQIMQRENYVLELPRAILEEVDCEKQFKKLCKTVIELIEHQSVHPFFTVRVLKVRRNLAVCFPMEGIPASGDRFANGTISALAPVGDGTMILQIGQDQAVKLPLNEGDTERGQHRLTL